MTSGQMLFFFTGAADKEGLERRQQHPGCLTVRLHEIRIVPTLYRIVPRAHQSYDAAQR